MLLKNVLVVNAVAGAAVASPPSTLHRRQDVNSFIQTEKPIALQGILNNFGPNGNYSRGAAPGIPVAGNSETNLPSLVHGLIAGTKSLETLIQQYVTSQAKLQTMPNPSGNLSDGANLGEPKFNINLTAFNQPWGRPQSDGSPARASALLAYGNYLLGHGQHSNALENVWPVVRNDLGYIGQYWNKTSFDLWEEVNSTSFFTIASQHKALVEGKNFASALGQNCEACAVIAPQLLCHLQEFWNGTAVIANHPTANYPVNSRSGVDVNTVLASINTFDPAAKCDDVTFQPCSSRAQSNHKVVVDGFRSIYGVNKGRTAGKAAAVGRYTEDVFMGGNPWYLATLAAAELLYDALYQWDKQGSLQVTSLSLPFFRDLIADIKPAVYPKSTPAYQNITSAVRTYADGFISVVQEYTPATGALSEEFDRKAGTQVPAPDLTWSYASFSTAVARRNGSAPVSWGSSAALAVPERCRGTTMKGNYAAPGPSSW